MKRQSVSHLESQSTPSSPFVRQVQQTRPITRSFGQIVLSAATSAASSVSSTRLIYHTAVAALLGGLLAACSSPDPQAIDYKSTSRQQIKAPSLAAPPDIMAEDPGSQGKPGNMSLQGYRTSTGTPIAVQTVLPGAQGLHIERDGTQRWLVVSSMPTDRVWEQIRAFWQTQGFVLTEDSRDRGIMQTDWRETRPKVDQGLIRNTLSIAVNNGYVSAQRDRFRTRIEKAPDGATYVFISQQGLHQQLTGNNNDNSTWESMPNDPGMEADYLGRLERALAQGPTPSVIDEERPQPPVKTAARGPSAMPVVAPVQLPGGVTPIEGGFTLAEDYDHAWARTGNALDRGNFTVDNRDRSRGLYFIRYVDPSNLGTAAQGFWSQLFKGKHEKVATQFRINVRAITPDSTNVVIQDSNGAVDNSALAQRIMHLLGGLL